MTKRSIAKRAFKKSDQILWAALLGLSVAGFMTVGCAPMEAKKASPIDASLAARVLDSSTNGTYKSDAEVNKALAARFLGASLKTEKVSRATVPDAATTANQGENVNVAIVLKDKYEKLHASGVVSSGKEMTVMAVTDECRVPLENYEVRGVCADRSCLAVSMMLVAKGASKESTAMMALTFRRADAKSAYELTYSSDPKGSRTQSGRTNPYKKTVDEITAQMQAGKLEKVETFTLDCEGRQRLAAAGANRNGKGPNQGLAANATGAATTPATGIVPPATGNGETLSAEALRARVQAEQARRSVEPAATTPAATAPAAAAPSAPAATVPAAPSVPSGPKEPKDVGPIDVDVKVEETLSVRPEGDPNQEKRGQPILDANDARALIEDSSRNFAARDLRLRQNYEN